MNPTLKAAGYNSLAELQADLANQKGVNPPVKPANKATESGPNSESNKTKEVKTQAIVHVHHGNPWTVDPSKVENGDLVLVIIHGRGHIRITKPDNLESNAYLGIGDHKMVVKIIKGTPWLMNKKSGFGNSLANFLQLQKNPPEDLVGCVELKKVL
ncbi:MAG: hypothetical protein WCF92_01360 [bacterium]